MEDSFGVVLGAEAREHAPRIEVLSTIGVPREAVLAFAGSLVRVAE
jgi:hypothetical protein